MLPFVPGMLGSRKKGGELRDIYSGVEPVPVRAGRWWEVGSTPFEGARIKEWRPHWSILHKSHAEDAALYGSEEEKWKHNPILHPVRYLRDPYYLEEKHYEDQGPFHPAYLQPSESATEREPPSASISLICQLLGYSLQPAIPMPAFLMQSFTVPGTP